jgi:hypothetical protein
MGLAVNNGYRDLTFVSAHLEDIDHEDAGHNYLLVIDMAAGLAQKRRRG